MYKAVLFDLDGTLLDTSEGILRSIDDTLDHFNLPQLSEEHKRNFIGPPIMHSFKETYNLTDEKAVQTSNYFRDIYKDIHLIRAVIYKGIIDVLSFLSEKGIRIAVATYKRNDYAKTLLKHFDISKFCDYILGSDYDNKLSKTDIVNKCLKALNILNPAQAVLVGDTNSDALSAKQCGIDFIAVSYGFGFKNISDAEKTSPVFIAATPQELLTFFSSNF